MKKPEFTIEQGIETQQRQLKQWKKVLKPEIYAELVRLINEKTEREKNTYTDGYSVFRGADIDSAIQNWFILNNDWNK